VRVFSILISASLLIASPALACEAVTPAVKSWAQCGYKVAHETGDHRFMKSMAEAMWLDKKLKKTSPQRWAGIETRIVKRCGSFARAQAKDRGKDAGSSYIPKDQFAAIADTSDIDKLVRK